VTPPTRPLSSRLTVPEQSTGKRPVNAPAGKSTEALQPLPGRNVAADPELEIHVASGAGSGPTRLAAFDAALCAVGVANYNLIRLSSVIPPGSVLNVSTVPLSPPGRWGDRLYLVLAEAHADVPGVQAHAGIGWIRDPALGRGLLVEHEGPSGAGVRADIEASLASMRRGRGDAGDRLSDVQMVAQGVTCNDQPVCALVVAVFAAEPWHVSARPGPSDRSCPCGAGRGCPTSR
jgi:arginine decarboxylase